MHLSSILPNQKPKPLSKRSTEQSCLTKRYQWILPLSGRLQETNLKAVEEEEGVREGPGAGAEARVEAEVAREHDPRALMEISNKREDVASTYTLILAERARRALEQELRNPRGSQGVPMLYHEI
jgi:hypothetical protein